MDVTDLFSIKGRVAVVTGGSAGIGRHIALRGHGTGPEDCSTHTGSSTGR